MRKPGSHKTTREIVGFHQSSIRRSCERCRSRKTRCSGDSPSCESCLQSRETCNYGNRIQRHPRSRNQILQLKEEVNRLKSELQSYKNHSNNSFIEKFKRSTCQQLNVNAATTATDSTTKDDSRKPVGIGTMILSHSGSLHLEQGLTFFRPGVPYRIKDWGALEEPTEKTNGLAHEAEYIPVPFKPEFHNRLIDLCFDYGISFGVNTFKDEFIEDMRSEVVQPDHYFSPLLHISCLVVGYRYSSVKEQISFQKRMEKEGRTEDVSLILLAKARIIAEEEVSEPALVTILGLLVLSLSCFGMAFDRVGTMYYSMAMSLSQEFRIHQRCDEQLRTKNLYPGCKIDVLRRDICGFIQVYSCWYMQYVARLTVPLHLELDQQLPVQKEFIRGSCDPNRHYLSQASRCHVKLSQIGTETFYCNHVWYMSLEERTSLVAHYVNRLKEWRASLPIKFSWPQSDVDEIAELHPSVATLIAEYDAYTIQLLRPYLMIDLGKEAQINALELCISAADEAVSLVRHIKDHYGGRNAPLCLQMMISIVGFFLILCASGIANSPTPAMLKAKRQLSVLLCWLDEFAEVWPTSAQTAESIRRLKDEYCSFVKQ